MRPFLTCLLAGCLPAFLHAADPIRAGDNRAERAQNVLRQHCAGCHGPYGTSNGGFNYVLDHERLLAREQVIAGKPDDSPLLQRIEQGEMPPVKRPRLNADEIKVLRHWIASGAPPFRPTKPPSLVTELQLARMVLADLKALEPRQRRFTRYLSLTHLANAQIPEDILRSHRHALAKLVNSLSWHARITPPKAVNEAGTIFRLDLRDYKWSLRMWERLALVYPYRWNDTNAAAKACAQWTESAQPCLRGDWFVATAAQPPFYHDFLQLPSTDRALERQLQVDVLANIHDDNAIRAGFNGSGVAKNNRILERHDAVHGAYWRSYDFSDNTGNQNIFERPLGPQPGPSAAVPAGGEIIFHLPNGLQSYLLVDAQGRRVDKAPGNIVSDPDRPDRLVVNGLSCMSCHVRGLLPKDDQVRAHVWKNPTAFSYEDRNAILALYPRSTRMRRAMKEDMERFATALQKAGVPLDGPEPIKAVTLRYEGVVDLRQAAAELGLSPEDFAAGISRSAELTRALGALRARGGTVQRQVFEDNYPKLQRVFSLGNGAEEAAGAPAKTTWAGHPGNVCDLAFSPDGRLGASAGEDRTVRIWDLATRQQRQLLEGHTDEVTCLAFSSEGRYLLSGSRDRTLRLWDVNTGEFVRRFVGPTDAVRAVAISADDRFALSAGDDRTLRLWELKSGKEVRALTGHTGAVTCVAFSPDGRRALSGSKDRSVRLWDVSSGKELSRWSEHTGAVLCVAFAPDGRLAASAGGDCVLRLWDVASGKQVHRSAGHAHPIIRVVFAPDGKRVLTGSRPSGFRDRFVRVWDVSTGREATSLAGVELEGIDCLAFSPDTRQVLLSPTKGEFRVLRLSR